MRMFSTALIFHASLILRTVTIFKRFDIATGYFTHLAAKLGEGKKHNPGCT